MNVQEFYREFGNFLGVPSDVKILSVDETVYYQEGCPTCGGDYEFSVCVLGTYNNGKRFCKSYDGRLLDFMQHLEYEQS